jgi:hypothetical protein
MVTIQYAHGQVDFQIMNEATNGPRYGERTMKQDQMLIFRLSWMLVEGQFCSEESLRMFVGKEDILDEHQTAGLSNSREEAMKDSRGLK